MTVGSTLRAIRAAHGWTQRDAARLLGIQRRRVQYIEDGDDGRDCPAHRLIRLIDARPEIAVVLEKIASDGEKTR